jgi:hypothetical protein
MFVKNIILRMEEGSRRLEVLKAQRFYHVNFQILQASDFYLPAHQ